MQCQILFSSSIICLLAVNDFIASPNCRCFLFFFVPAAAENTMFWLIAFIIFCLVSVHLLQCGPQIIFVIDSSSISGTSISPFATSTGIFYGSGVASTFDSSSHNVYWGINPTSKTSPPPSFLPSPSLNLHTVQAPPLPPPPLSFFRQSQLYIGFS